MNKRRIDPDAKARRSQLRSAGHYWGSKAADAVIAESKQLSADKIERRLQQVIAEREAALREIGTDAGDVAAWVGACAKQFLSRLCRRSMINFSRVNLAVSYASTSSRGPQ